MIRKNLGTKNFWGLYNKNPKKFWTLSGKYAKKIKFECLNACTQLFYIVTR